ncbi:unnamed protein product [Lactuca virosa]|uniref:Serine-threonine/tyrosine-protein kinase catalytic domain-containing protein n=1 Tax=Lactuca virosa TaxID=75947 RepID=A0AAU9PHQ3_9ASTR|nr:unnamed protein product [Lactuca virosa]
MSFATDGGREPEPSTSAPASASTFTSISTSVEWKRAVDKSLDEEQWGLVGWAQEYIKEGKLKHIVDSDIKDQISTKCLKEFVRITERCLVCNPKQRLMMTEVVFSLDFVLTLQEKTNSSLQAGRQNNIQ